jgi:serine/alanine adding enzyme
VWPDVYFEPTYGLAEQEAGAGAWETLTAFDGAFQLPFHMRSADPLPDAISPYGYSGVYADPALSSQDVSRAWSASIGCLRDLGTASLFLRQSPFFALPPLSDPAVRQGPAHTTYAVAIADPQVAWEAMEGRCRTSIRKALGSGCVGTVSDTGIGDLLEGGDFRTLYDATMQRRDASARYLFDDAYYRALHRGLGGRLLLARVAGHDGATLAAALLMRSGPRLHYHLSGSTAEGSRAGATNLMLWEAVKHGASSGAHTLHLGGGLQEGDSLSRFKRSFGGEALSFVASGVVLDEQAYTDAVRARAAQLRIGVQQFESAPTFPAYRWDGQRR